MAQRGQIATAPGQGPTLELVKLGGQELYIPTGAIRAIRTDTNELDDVKMNPDGGLLVHDASASDANATAQHMATFVPPRALQYARTASDAMRVNVDSGNISLSSIQFGSSNTVPAWNSTGAGNSMDQREMQREQSQMSFRQIRSRWTIT